jgi:hypothetical protein
VKCGKRTAGSRKNRLAGQATEHDHFACTLFQNAVMTTCAVTEWHRPSRFGLIARDMSDECHEDVRKFAVENEVADGFPW